MRNRTIEVELWLGAKVATVWDEHDKARFFSDPTDTSIVRLRRYAEGHGGYLFDHESEWGWTWWEGGDD